MLLSHIHPWVRPKKMLCCVLCIIGNCDTSASLIYFICYVIIFLDFVVGSLTTHAEGNWVLRGARASERNFVVFIFLWVGVGVQLYNVYTELHHWRQHPQSIALGCSRFHVCGIILTSIFPGVRWDTMSGTVIDRLVGVTKKNKRTHIYIYIERDRYT